jgi:Domain of unknown function (DUF4157)
MRDVVFDRRTVRREEVPPARRSLSVGRVDDPAEREADATSERVMAWIASRAQRDDEQQLFRFESSRIRRNATAPVAPEVGPAGGDLSPDLDRRVRAGGGQPLDDATRSRFEPAFGTSFRDVRVHVDSDVAPRIGARAFTLGADVHFAPGQYRPDTADGARTLAHELTHVVQQTGRVQRAAPTMPASGVTTRPTRIVRRDIGFEFESKNFQTKRRNDGGASLPAAAFANAPAASAAYHDPQATRINKGAVILDRNDIEVQADDAGNDSDLEAVTTHFPETNAGRARLDSAVTRLGLLILGGETRKVGHTVTSKALDGVAGFTNRMPDGMIYGDWIHATTSPQVTIGIRLGNVGDIVKDLHGNPREKASRTGTRAPGRLHMRAADPTDATRPTPLTPGNEAQTLVDAHQLAVRTLRAFRQGDPNAPGGVELEGFLTIIFAYIEAAARKTAFLKSHTPLMAKTDLATAWRTLPNNVTTFYGATNKSGVTRFERLIASAPGYAARMSRPVFDVDAKTKGIAENNRLKKSGAAKSKQWYHKLTLRSWVRAIAVHQNQTAGDAVREFFTGTQLRGVDQLTTANFPDMPGGQIVEGYGALGPNMDTDATTGARLPVFELRSASRKITFAEARQWSLDVFDYIRSLNENPGGGHQKMT